MEPEQCPKCFSTVKYFNMNYNEAVYLCSNEECTYPLETPHSLITVKRNFTESFTNQKTAAEADKNKSLDDVEALLQQECINLGLDMLDSDDFFKRNEPGVEGRDDITNLLNNIVETPLNTDISSLLKEAFGDDSFLFEGKPVTQKK